MLNGVGNINQFAKKYTEKDYIGKCIDLNLEYKGFSRLKKKGTMIHFICPIHRDKGEQIKDWSHFKTYSRGCTYCSGRGKTNMDILPMIKNKDVKLVSNYLGNEKPIECECKKCGNKWITLPKVLITNGSGCPKCGRENAHQKMAKSQSDFEDELREINPDIEVIGEYVNTHTKIKCRCRIDGKEWFGYPANLLNKSAGCPHCNISLAEKDMLSVLDKLNINYIPQHTIDGCNYISKLRFDAFDIEDNIAFEYNGEQHYQPIDLYGKGEEYALQEFDKVKNRDKAKIQFCKKNDIPIIIVPYWERNNMEAYIVNELKRIKSA